MAIIMKPKFQALVFLIFAGGAVGCAVAGQLDLAVAFLAASVLGVAGQILLIGRRNARLLRRVDSLAAEVSRFRTAATESAESYDFAALERRLLATLEIEREQNLRRHEELLQKFEDTSGG